MSVSSNNAPGAAAAPAVEELIQPDKTKILEDLCRNGTLSRMRSHARLNDITIEELNGEEAAMASVGQWLSLIFIASKAVKIVFKTHYQANDIRFFAANALELPNPDRVTQKQIEDFVKEFCNLSAGIIKIAFEETGSRISLPMVTRASDDMFFNSDYNGGKQVFEDRWLLKHAKGQMACSVVIEVFDKKSLDRIILPSFGANDDNGDVEFF